MYIKILIYAVSHKNAMWHYKILSSDTQVDFRIFICVSTGTKIVNKNCSRNARVIVKFLTKWHIFISQSLMCQADVVGFWCVTPFWNQSASKVTGVENWCQILHFLTTVSFRRCSWSVSVNFMCSAWDQTCNILLTGCHMTVEGDLESGLQKMTWADIKAF